MPNGGSKGIPCVILGLNIPMPPAAEMAVMVALSLAVPFALFGARSLWTKLR